MALWQCRSTECPRKLSSPWGSKNAFNLFQRPAEKENTLKGSRLGKIGISLSIKHPIH